MIPAKSILTNPKFVGTNYVFVLPHIASIKSEDGTILHLPKAVIYNYMTLVTILNSNAKTSYIMKQRE